MTPQTDGQRDRIAIANTRSAVSAGTGAVRKKKINFFAKKNELT